MDDLAVALLGLRWLLRSLPPAAAEGHLLAVGLSQVQLDADLHALGRVAATLGRHGVRWASAAALIGARRLETGLRRLLRGHPNN
jgi:hypothetical protein